MTDLTTDFDFLPLRVIWTSVDGKNHYDPVGKRKLIEACQRSGASVAGLALRAGVNANQLRKWISLERVKTRRAQQLPDAHVPAFVPVVEVFDATLAGHPLPDALPTPTRGEPVRTSQRPPLPSRLTAQLPNGVSVALECAAHDAALVTAMTAALGAR
jgi:transposase